MLKITLHIQALQTVFPFIRDMREKDERAYWSLIPKEQQRTGEVAGLPTTRGVMIATRGIWALIQQEDGLLEVHKDWFILDRRQEKDLVVLDKVHKNKHKSAEEMAKELLELLT